MAVQKPDNAAFETTLVALDGELKALQATYEQYFLGMERVPPTRAYEDLKRALMALKRERIRNTGLKFRLDALWQRFLSYERMWQRTVKEIEEGRYHRDVFKARMRGHVIQRPTAASKDGAAEEAEAPGPRPAAPGAVPKRAARPGGSEGLGEEKLKKLFDAFVTAKKRCKEDTSNLSLDAMRRSLSKQVPAIKEKHGAKSVDFKVVIKNGKAILKAVPR